MGYCDWDMAWLWGTETGPWPRDGVQWLGHGLVMGYSDWDMTWWWDTVTGPWPGDGVQWLGHDLVMGYSDWDMAWWWGTETGIWPGNGIQWLGHDLVMGFSDWDRWWDTVTGAWPGDGMQWLGYDLVMGYRYWDMTWSLDIVTWSDVTKCWDIGDTGTSRADQWSDPLIWRDSEVIISGYTTAFNNFAGWHLAQCQDNVTEWAGVPVRQHYKVIMSVHCHKLVPVPVWC